MDVDRGEDELFAAGQVCSSGCAGGAVEPEFRTESGAGSAVVAGKYRRDVIEVQHRSVQHRAMDDEGPGVLECLGHDLAELPDDDVDGIDPSRSGCPCYGRSELARQRHLMHRRILSETSELFPAMLRETPWSICHRVSMTACDVAGRNSIDVPKRVEGESRIMPNELHGWRAPTLGENLAQAGVGRREFLKFCGALAAVFAVGDAALAGPAQAAPVTAEMIADKLEALTKPNVVWLQLQECTGCMESTLRSGGTTVEDLVLNLLSVNYNELVMAAAGDAANKALDETNAEPHILVVNGSIPLGAGGAYCTIGGKSAEQVLRESAENATAILAVGACAVWGSVQASRPNPTGAVGVDEIIRDKAVVNVSGCPPIGEVITATLAYILTHDTLPDVDAEGRPLFAYDQRIHDSCTRRAHFDAGQFVRTFDDEGARSGWCLYEVGCKGPSTFSACPIIQWNLHTSWPIGAGHPCIGCTEKDFFDRFTPFYHTLPNVTGLGIEATAEKIGWGLVGATVAGVSAHAGLTAVRRAGARKREAQQPLEAFGDSRVWLPMPTVPPPDPGPEGPDGPATTNSAGPATKGE